MWESEKCNQIPLRKRVEFERNYICHGGEATNLRPFALR
jgi:hypothetical protein